MDGMNSNGFPGGNGASMMQQMSYSSMQNIPNQQQQQQQQGPPPMGPGPAMNDMNGGGMNVNGNIVNQNSPGDMCNPKRQAVFDRLKKRMGTYRKRQVETVPRFDQTFTGICEQQSIETNVLQKRFIETKAKRVAKKADKKSETAPTGSLVRDDVFISLLIGSKL